MDHMRCVFFLLFCTVCLQSALSDNLINATLTLLPEAVEVGAVCLDGSPPGYYMRPGSNSDKWRIHLMGGGWCGNVTACYERSFTFLGSTKPYPQSYGFNAFLSDNPVVNPDFYDWNMVFIIYCDGASFAGDREEPDEYNGRLMYYRGYRILKFLFHHLKELKGLDKASDVILTGCSAGGLAVFLHADFVGTLIHGTFKALPDAGYFLDIQNLDGQNYSDVFKGMIKLQNVDEAFMHDCKQAHNSSEMWRCTYAPYIYQYIKTPLFVLNSQYDTSQIEGFYGLKCLPPDCSPQEMVLFEYFKKVWDQQVEPVISSSSTNGYFLNSCLIHCQSFQDDVAWTTYAVDGHLMRKSVGDWYYERSTASSRLKDCDYPCNPTCTISLT